MAIPVKSSITIGNGEPLTHYHSLSIEQDMFNHHTFRVVVPYDKPLETEYQYGLLRQTYTNYCGKFIAIVLTQKESTDSKQHKYPPLEFTGIITNVTLANVSDFDYSYVLSGYSPTYLLEDAPQRRTFVKQTLQQIFEQVLGPYSSNLLPRGPLIPQYQKLIEYAVQYDESPYVFLRRLADEYGEWFYYNGQKLRLRLPTEQDPQTFVVRSGQKFDLAIDLKPSEFVVGHRDYLARQQNPKFPISYVGRSRGQALSQPVHSFTSFALKQSVSLFTHPARLLASRPVYSQQQLDADAQRRKESQANRLVTFKGTGENPGFGVGRRMEAQGYGRREAKDPHDYGPYLLTKVTHWVDDKGQYHNEFEALPDQVQHPPTNPLAQPPQGVPELARVIDVADQKNLGRIRLRYAWPVQPPGAETDWVRVSTPYSGKGYGQLFTPEVGSEVLVGYEQGRPESPVVLGNLFHPHNEQQAKQYTYPENHLKYIQTAAGNAILFDDQDKRERIVIQNNNPSTNSNSSLHISFAASGTILLKTTGRIRLEADEEIVLASKRIELKTKQNGVIALNADLGDIELTTSLVAIKGDHVNVEAGDHVKIDAANEITMKSNGTTELSGPALATIKGNPVKIN